MMILRFNTRYIVYGAIVLLVLFNLYLWLQPTSPTRVVTENEVLHKLNHTLHTVHGELLVIHNKLLQTKPKLAAVAAPHVSIDTKDAKQIVKERILKKKTAVLFTMDSIESYEKNSLSGGAAGELIIRHSLEYAMNKFGVKLRVIRSDAEFNKVNMNNYDIIILDPWTWAAKGWVPKKNLVGHESKIYILDFFGSPTLRGSLKIDSSKVLTAFGSKWNSFLGYFMTSTDIDLQSTTAKLNRGVIWGKDTKHFEGKDRMIRAVAEKTKLVSTATNAVFQHPNIDWLGHQTSSKWKQILLQNKFLIGLGNPLLGPSAIDAISSGCVFINPVYNEPMRDGAFKSQHPYAMEKIGPPYVCSFQEGNTNALLECVDKALATNLKPFIPEDFKEENYLLRVEKLFELF